MPSTYFFIMATLLLSLNSVRVLGLAASDWFYFGALGLAAAETITVQRRLVPRWWKNRFLWVASIILFGAILSTANSINIRVAIIEIFQQTFVMTLFVSLVWIMVNRGKVSPIIMAFILSGVFTAGIALVDYLTGSKLGPTISATLDLPLWERYAGALGHPNKQGYFLTLTTLLSLGQIFIIRLSRFKPLHLIFWGLILAIQLSGLYLSGSLTSYLGLLLGIIVFASSSKIFFFQVIRATGIIAIIGVLGLSIAMIFNAFIPSSAFNLEKSWLMCRFCAKSQERQ